MAYRVGNPRGIKAGRRVLRVEDRGQTEREWAEGDAIKPEDIADDKVFASYLKRGLIVEDKHRGSRKR